jgi:hypothetical protein
VSKFLLTIAPTEKEKYKSAFFDIFGSTREINLKEN